MFINGTYINVRYYTWVPSEDEPGLAHKSENEIHIYDGRETPARIHREIPDGATVESDTGIDKGLKWTVQRPLRVLPKTPPKK